MRALLTARARTSRTRGSALLCAADTTPCRDGGPWREDDFEFLHLLHPRGLSTAAASSGRGAGGGVRKRMMPLIKLVHPDMFAQYPSNVASTNSKSLKDLNTLIDAAEALEASANGAIPTRGGSAARPPAVDPFYSLTFFHHQPNQRREQQQPDHPNDGNDERNNTRESGGGDSADSSELLELRAELRFPQALSSDPAGSLRRQLNRQLDGLLKRVSAAAVGGVSGQVDGDQVLEEMYGGGRGKRGGMGGDMKMRGGGETEDDFHSEGFRWRGRRQEEWCAPPRDGIRTERASSSTDRDQRKPRMTSEELRRMTLEHAGDNHHVNPWDAGAGSGFFGGGVGGLGSNGAGGYGGSGNAEATAQARSRRVDDFLRSGRVQFAGVPVAREASALLNLHRALVKHFEHLELHDRGLWSTVILVLKAKSEKYEVQVHSSGPVLVIPEKFSERNLVRFLSEVLLSSLG